VRAGQTMIRLEPMTGEFGRTLAILFTDLGPLRWLAVTIAFLPIGVYEEPIVAGLRRSAPAVALARMVRLGGGGAGALVTLEEVYSSKLSIDSSVFLGDTQCLGTPTLLLHGSSARKLPPRSSIPGCMPAAPSQ